MCLQDSLPALEHRRHRSLLIAKAARDSKLQRSSGSFIDNYKLHRAPGVPTRSLMAPTSLPALLNREQPVEEWCSQIAYMPGDREVDDPWCAHLDEHQPQSEDYDILKL